MRRVISKKMLRKLINEEIDILLEQETEETEAVDVEGEETDEEAEEEVEEEEPPGEVGTPLASSLDNELNALFVDFESSALVAAKEQKRQNENRLSLKRFLFEQEGEDIDMETFAADVARLVKNYDSLLDIPRLIMVKAKDYIEGKYGEDIADQLLDILDLRYQLSIEEEEPIVAPIAVGASAEAAAAG